MPMTKGSRRFEVSVRFQLLVPSLFSVTSIIIVNSALDPVGCSRVGHPYRVFFFFENVSGMLLGFGVQGFSGFMFFFSSSRAVFRYCDDQFCRMLKGERGSFEDGEKAQLVLGLCGILRCIRADRLGARGSGEGRVASFCVRRVKELFGGYCCTLVEDRARALTSQSGVRYEGGGHI